jgi:hypothetical protein
MASPTSLPLSAPASLDSPSLSSSLGSSSSPAISSLGQSGAGGPAGTRREDGATRDSDLDDLGAPLAREGGSPAAPWGGQHHRENRARYSEAIDSGRLYFRQFSSTQAACLLFCHDELGADYSARGANGELRLSALPPEVLMLIAEIAAPVFEVHADLCVLSFPVRCLYCSRTIAAAERHFIIESSGGWRPMHIEHWINRNVLRLR